MSATDRAFIEAFSRSAMARPGGTDPSETAREASSRAYVLHGPQSRPGSPHISLPPRGAPARPLSAVARPTDADDRFQPALGVDRFSWPAVCDRLVHDASDRLDAAARRLAGEAAHGRGVVAVAGCHRGAGCTTTLLCLARRLAAMSIRVALVDADFGRPALADRLGLLAQNGWEDVLCDALPLAEAVVEAVEDHVALLPLRGPLGDAVARAGNLPASISLGVLRRNFRVVLVDLGAVLDDASSDGPLTLARNGGIDGLLLVRDVRGPRGDEVSRAVDRIAGTGVPVLGVAETFAASEVGHAAEGLFIS